MDIFDSPFTSLLSFQRLMKMKAEGFDSASLLVVAASSLKYYTQLNRHLIEGYEYLNDFALKTILNASPDDLADFIDKACDIKRGGSLFFLTLASPSFITLIDNIHQKIDCPNKTIDQRDEIFNKLNMFFYPQSQYDFNLKGGAFINLMGFNNIAHYFVYFQEYALRDPLIKLSRDIVGRDLYDGANIYADTIARYSNYLYFINKFGKQLELENKFNFKLPKSADFCRAIDWDNFLYFVRSIAPLEYKENKVAENLNNYWPAFCEKNEISIGVAEAGIKAPVLKV